MFRYKTLVSSGSQDSSILALAEEFNLAPCLMARIILEYFIRKQTPDVGMRSRGAKKIIRNIFDFINLKILKILRIQGEAKLKSLVSSYMQHPEDLEDER